MTTRSHDLRAFYDLLNALERRLGGKRTLGESDGRMMWPTRGVYFFFENGEERKDSGRGPRVVRVGTHALTGRSRTTLWNRLAQHRGALKTGGGNHRGSIFRLFVGTALIDRDPSLTLSTWGQGSSAPRECRESEHHLEALVSRVIRQMPFLWLAVEDSPGLESLRGYIERNAIALLSNWGKDPCDPASHSWLGNYCARERVKGSGLWNNNHVDEEYDPRFLVALEKAVCAWSAHDRMDR